MAVENERGICASKFKKEGLSLITCSIYEPVIKLFILSLPSSLESQYVFYSIQGDSLSQGPLLVI
jgi:hypothetical protein